MVLTKAQVLEEAFAQGFDALEKAHPTLRNYRDFAQKHLDRAAINAHLGALSTFVYSPASPLAAASPEEKQGYIINGLAGYIASVDAFDAKGKQIIFGSTLRRRLQSGNNLYRGSGSMERMIKNSAPVRWMYNHNPVRFLNRTKADKTDQGRRYFDEAVDAGATLYDVIKKDPGLQERHPEIGEAATTLYDSGFLEFATKVLGERKLIRPSEEYRVRKDLYNLAKDSTKRITTSTREYIASKRAAPKVAASILGVLGAGILIVTGLGITGNVIDSTINNTATTSLAVNGTWAGFALGVLFLAIAALILVNRRKGIERTKKVSGRKLRRKR